MPIEEDFTLEPEVQFDCSFEIYASGTVWGAIEGDISNQIDLTEALNSKASADTVSTLSETVTNNYTELNDKITINTNNITDINSTMSGYGNIVTHNVSEFATALQGQKADNAVPNTRTVNGKVLSSNITLNYSDVGALSSTTTINNLTTTAQQNALNSGATTTNIGQISTNTNSINLINSKIPAQASTSNQLADKNFVNSSIATNTANFIGTFNSVAELKSYSGTVTNNDYAFVIDVDGEGNTVYDRYKYSDDAFNPDAFTVVGTPTITDEGIASGFSASNYLTKDLNLSGSSLKIRVPFKTSNVTKTQQLINNSNFQLRLLYVSASTALYPSLYVSDGVNTVTPRTSTYAIQANTDYVVEIEYKHDVSVDIKLYSASGVLLDSVYSTSAVNISAVIPNTTLTTYIGSNVGSAYLEGSIDLKNLLITVDGQEVLSGQGAWLFEYELNNSSFTASQWASINSGITSSDVTLIGTAIQPNDNISELTNDSGYITGITSSDVTDALGYTPVDVNDLSTVATSGSYNDLSNKPTIPTVNNATLTIQKNGTNVQTFTANASSDVTANITVPTDVSELANTTLANVSLSNLDAEGENRLHALKGYLDEGKTLTDTELYNDVHSYANSTFDLTKFTVIGNPKITDDGIASNLSTSNYLTAISPSMYYNKSNWHLQLEGEFDPNVHNDFMNFVNDIYAYLAYMDGWHSIVLQLYDTSDQQIFISIEQANDKFVKGDILLDIYYSSTDGYYFTATQNGATYTSSISSNTNQLRSANIQPLLYIHSSSTTSIDLKTIKFFVNNQIVFNGNKTGKDVILSGSSYAFFGTGTIVDSNNIASGFSSSSGIKYNINYTGNSYNTFELYLGEYELTTINVGQWFYKNAKIENSIQSGFLIQFNDQNKLRFFGGSGTANNDIFNGLIGSVTHSLNAKVKVKLVFDGSNYTLYSSDNGGAWVQEYTKATTLKILFPVEVTLGQDQNYFRGKINLNEIRTIINGSMKFSLTELSIPYILSSTGSKIVDSAYRDIVATLYNQKGRTFYYIIDYVNKNATLPMGEVYGLIESEIVDNPDKVQSANLINVNATDVVEPSVYKKLEKDYHSSFDLSKFTVVGSPVITDEGIASGFSSSNYLTLSSIPMNTNWRVEYAFNYVNNASAQVSLAIVNASTNKHIMRLWYRGNSNEAQIVPYYSNGNTFEAIPFNLVNNSNYKYIIFNDGTDINYQVINTDNNTIVTNGKKTGYDYTLGSINANVVIGVNNSHSEVFQGSIDLKQFSITVDGYPVFNGNKTDTDAIKSDDYTIVGTPTIATDGIASGFSASNYLTKDLNLSGNSLKIRVPFRTTNVTKTQLLIENTNFQLRLLYVSASTALYPSLYVSDGDNTVQPRTSTYSIQANTDYVVEIEYKHNVSADIKLYSANGVLLDSVYSTTSGTTSAVIPNTTLTTSIGSNVSTGYLEGSIDLNALKIYIDDNLIYQPCLLIPYTVSKDGKKIVDVIYQDRIIDVYNQYGSALYTVINEYKKTFNLPMGSLQGFITQKTIQNNFKQIQGYNANATQTLKHINGVLQWVTD